MGGAPHPSQTPEPNSSSIQGRTIECGPRHLVQVDVVRTKARLHREGWKVSDLNATEAEVEAVGG
jgi:hypothetical protein